MPRFVILQHEPGPKSGRPLHWDLMLEFDQVLRTWALAEPPCSGKSIAAEELPDHRIAYLEYTGPLTKGRGDVEQWDSGQFAWESRVLGNSLAITLSGERIACRVDLEQDVSDPRSWTLRFSDPPPTS